ncbi:hypothetical protein SAMN04490248_1582 [Salinihabitans flavidus]|uniref:Uncharacterized protein n=1 Tax=Salinihabitans flavidus TaxID=569882 RepID=A0A1H8WEJ9_9RHOB|nr:hypothetical protein SAMN04490248_1582 [Salinihabitans flavidus]
MARERAESFISRFLFRGSKERDQEAVAADVEPTPQSESVIEHELVLATNEERSAQKCCQTNANQSRSMQDGCALFSTETAPLGECGGAVQLEI